MREITNQNFDMEVLKCELPVFVCFTGFQDRIALRSLLNTVIAEEEAGARG